MVVRKELPDCNIILDCKDQDIVARTIKVLLDAGIPQGSYPITEHLASKSHPYLFWERSRGILNRLCDTNYPGKKTRVPEKFISYLLEQPIYELWL